MQSFRWSTEKAPDPKQTLPPFSVRICPFFNPLPMQIGQYCHRHHCPQPPLIEQQYHHHYRHPPVKSPTLIERWKCRRWLKKVQSSRYFGANIQRLTCNRYVFALYLWCQCRNKTKKNLVLGQERTSHRGHLKTGLTRLQRLTLERGRQEDLRLATQSYCTWERRVGMKELATIERC